MCPPGCSQPPSFACRTRRIDRPSAEEMIALAVT
jgi:hypothetical protein